MTALGIRYLTGNSVAADVAEESKPEWPPHPARVYMAMVAAHFETGADPAERAALEWLEQQSPPAISASEEQPRSSVQVFVAVNDEAGIGTTRSRQPRTFPTCRPDHDTVWFQYSQAAPSHLVEALTSLCRKVTRVGHSSSLVQVWLTDKSGVDPVWIPSPSGRTRFRIPEPGVLRFLEVAFNGQAISEYWALQEQLETAKGKAATQIKAELKQRFGGNIPTASRPALSSWAGYERTEEPQREPAPWSGPFSENILILSSDLESPVLGIESTLALTSALRNSLLKMHGKNCPAWVSGHDEGGVQTRKPHLAYFPLPFVGEAYGDGHLLGVAIAVPRGIDPLEIRRYLGAFLYQPDGVPKTIKLWQSGEPAWEWRVRLDTGSTAKTLQPATWTRPSELWASVTPVVLHHYPDKRKPGDIERIVGEAFRSAGLPEAAEIRIRPSSVFKGAGDSVRMPKMEQPGVSLTRFHVHVMARFNEHVQGPVLLGRGRFRGYGLMRPIGQREWKLWN